MVKYLSVAALGLIALLLLVLVIRQEGRQIRETVDESVSHNVDQAAEKAADRAVDRVIEKAPEAAVKTAGKTIGKIADGIFGAVDELIPPQSPAPDSKRPGIPELPGIPGLPSIPGLPGAPKEGQPPLDPTDLLQRVIKAGQNAAQRVDQIGDRAFGLSTAEEITIGRQAHQAILREHPLADDTAALARLRRLAQPLLEQVSRKEIEYRFFLVEDDKLNAFSHLGGYIYFHRGLYDLCEDDASLQFVLGHEIAHVDLRHCVQGLSYAARIEKWSDGSLAGLATLAYRMVALGYSEELEFAADGWSRAALRKLGRTEVEITRFMIHMEEELKNRGLSSTPKRPTSLPSAVGLELDNHFRTHPPLSERLVRLQKAAAKP